MVIQNSIKIRNLKFRNKLILNFMQYQIPQFIEVEDKIIGPLTIRQFIWLGAGGGISFILFQIIKPSFFAPLVVLIMSFSVVFAFVKINGRPFVSFLGALMNFTTRPTFYIWRRIPKTEKQEIKEEEEIAASDPGIKISESKLKELAWTLDMPEKEKL